MASLTSVTEVDVLASADANPTPAEILARAEAMVPTLVARQGDAEQRTYYSQQTHQEFADAGFYRILTPRRYGGYEMGIDTFLQVSMTLARGCPSTGWMYCLGATHALAAASLFDERAQREIFSSPDFIAPATIVPNGYATRGPDGGWVINGTWDYCSGSPYATHFIGHTFDTSSPGEPVPMLFIAPRDQWRRLDNWGEQLGLKGSGSHSITIEDGHIPDAFTVPGFHLSTSPVSERTPGRELHDNPEYGGGPLSFMTLEGAALAVGIAQGALDAYGDLMRSRTTLLPPIVARAEDPDYQSWYAEAAGMIATAEAALLGAIRQWQDTCDEGPFSRLQDLRITTICRHIIQLCWSAAERYLFPTAGSSALRQGERLERIWRDMSMLHSHAGFSIFLPTKANREYTATYFG